MQMIIRLVVSISLIFGVALAAAQSERTMLSSRIVDADTKAPVAGSVTVFMRHEGSLVMDTATAGEDGVFKLVVPTKPHRMLVWAENYAPRNIDDPAPAGDIALSPLESWTIQVVDRGNKPVPNATVHLRYVAGASAYLPEWITRGLDERQFRTDSDGFFVVNGMMPSPDVAGRVEYRGRSYSLQLVEPEAFTASPVTAPSREQPRKTMMLAIR